MSLIETFVRRPVLSTVMSLVIILLGIIGYGRLNLRQYPKVDQPTVSVKINFEGAGPRVVESAVTKPIENSLMGIEGIETISSSSKVGVSEINITFSSERDIESAANDVRERVARVRPKLPPTGITNPEIKKADSDARAILWLSLSSNTHKIAYLADYAKRFIENQLEAVNGVAGVEITGAGKFEMRLVVNPLRMASANITADDVVNAVKHQNVDKPAGKIITKKQEIIVSTHASLNTEEDFNNMIIKETAGHVIRLKDIGYAELTSIDRFSRSRFNGETSVTIAITKQSVANPLDVVNRIKALLPEMKRQAQANNINLDIAFDDTTFVRKSLDKVQTTLYEAVGLVVLVVLLTIGSIRGSLIPVVTIPVSLIGASFFMYLMGFTLNSMTFLALILGIGLVVDDAIVVLENVYRYIEKGLKPIDAAITGVREIQFPVIAMTLTLAAVYAPIGLSEGVVGKMFTEFALTLTVAVLISGFAALTLSPAMCAYILKPFVDHDKTKGFKRLLYVVDNWLSRLNKSYEIQLKKVLKNRKFVIFAGIIFSLFGFLIGYSLKSELFPEEDSGAISVVAFPPSGATIDFNDRYIKIIESYLNKTPEIEAVMTSVKAPGKSNIFARLKDWKDRDRTVGDVVAELSPKIKKITGMQVQIHPFSSNPFSGGDGNMVNIVLKSYAPLTILQKISKQFQAALGKVDGIKYVLAPVFDGGQEYEIIINREKAIRLGIRVSTIADTIDALIRGRVSGRFTYRDKKNDIRVELPDEFRKSPDDLSKIFVRGIKDKREVMVPVSELTTIQKKNSPLSIAHFGGVRSVTLHAALDDGVSIGEAIGIVKDAAIEYLPDNVVQEFSGQARRFTKEQGNVLLIYAMAIAFIYLVLSAQYESFRDPIMILLSVPLSIAGAIIVLALAGGSINVYSQIGFVTLIGLITKHAILIVDFANELQRNGMDKLEAIIESSKLRLRPIIMTTLAMVFGAIPLALSAGAGAESRQQIGWVIVGGMSIGTIFTLFIIPAVYTYMGRNLKNKRV